MTVKIQVRDSTGAFRYRDANVGEFAETALRQIVADGSGYSQPECWRDGWRWLRQYLCKLCIRKAEESLENPAKADLWYRRYQAIRGIE